MFGTAIANPIFIAKPNSLARLVRTLQGEAIVAVDTESNSLFAYQEQVCLIQFSTRSQDFLVDPLTLLDLLPLGEIFSDPRIEKVFHAAEYDIICLKRDFGFEFNNVFDTMIAARILGTEEIGLGALLEAEFEIHLDKRHQRANWGQRPLPPHLLAYAQMDTHYLIPLRERLGEKLEEKGLEALAAEDFERVRRVNGRESANRSESRQDEIWRMRGTNDLTAQQAAVLQELCRYRDQVARATNRPLFKVISDQTLVAIAERCPKGSAELEAVDGMTARQMALHARGLLAAVGRGLQAEPIFPSRGPRPDDQFLERLERLRTWRKATAQEMGVNSDVVLPRDLMVALAEGNPRTGKELDAILSEVPWRRERFGEQILKLIGRGKKS